MWRLEQRAPLLASKHKAAKRSLFVLINVVVGPLLALVASMKATVSLYRKYVFVSGVYTRAVGASFLKVSTLTSIFVFSENAIKLCRSRVNKTRISKQKFAFSGENVFV